jgi:hypothetical protein
VTIAQDATTVLAELSSARTPWLALALADPAGRSRLAEVADDVTVIDITDPQAVPLMVNPLEPAPGYPVQAHADRLAGLFEATFGPGEPVAGALRAGLRRVYADCGWDMVTGAARPGAVSPPAVPAFRQLKLATVDAARDLGFDPGMRAGVRGFLEARLDALWAGAAGLFLEGGHPASPARLLGGNVLITGSALADEEAASFLAGVLLLRLSEQLSRRMARPRAPAGQAGGPDGRDQADGTRPVIVVAVPASLPGLPGPSGLASPSGPVPPAFPAGLGLSSRGAAWFGRVLEDLRLAGADIVIAPAAGAGSVWVIPQLRWVHQMERLSPFGRDRLRPDDIAPPLDFGLTGLPDWPGIRVADRLGGLRGHPLAMESERNRTAAMTALLGDGRAGLDADLALTGMGVSPPRRLRHAARAMGAAGHGGQPGWLEVVLSWPHRLIGPAPEIPEILENP